MTTKKKSTPKSGEKSKTTAAAKGKPAKALTEPTATATRATMKPEKVEKVEKAEPIEKTAMVETVEKTATAETVEQVAKVEMVQETPSAAPIASASAPAEAPAAVEVSVTAQKPVLTIGMFQKRLHEHGYYHGWWDGDYGPLTKHAVACFQAANGLHPDGEPTPATLAALGF